MSDKKSTSSEKVIEISMSFFITLIVTFVLLVGVVVGIFVIANLDKGQETPVRDPKPKATTTADPAIEAGANKTPLYPTTETRTSYKITTSEDVVTLTDNSFITGRNTVLVKLGADSLTSIVEKNADAKMYPASMTKVMTLLVACEQVTDLDTMLTIEEKHLEYYNNNPGGSNIWAIEPDLAGEKISVKDALCMIYYESDTISCYLIAEHIAGSEAAFVELMNQKAQSIGLTGTHFANCTGLYNADHYSTCKDIASIMVYAMDNELAKEIIFSIKDYSFESYKFYKKDSTKKMTYYRGYPGWYEDRFNKNNKLNTCTVVTGKTGWIDESGVSLVSVAKTDNGEFYINVIVGNPNNNSTTQSTTEVKKIYNTYVK